LALGGSNPLLVFVTFGISGSGFFFFFWSGKLSAYVGQAILLLLHDGAANTSIPITEEIISF
jgi:hypothetical protein